MDGRLYYQPWNSIDEEYTEEMWTSPKSFLAYGVLAADRNTYVLATDSTLYYYHNGKITPVGDN